MIQLDSTAAAVVQVLGLIGVAGGIGGAIYAVSKSRGVDKSVGTLASANEALQRQVIFEQGQREISETHCEQRITDLREDHAHKIGVLQGQIDTLTGNVAHQIANRVVDVLEERENRRG